MKLVFSAGTGGDDIPVKPLGTSSAPVNWCKLHWAPTEEDWGTRKILRLFQVRYYREPKWIPQLYADFTTMCMPEGGFAYIILSPIWGIGEFDELRKSLEMSGFRSFVVSAKRGKEKTLFAQGQREHIEMVFKENSWQVGRHFILISREKIRDWAERLKESYESQGFDYDLLDRLECIVCNYWEHGIEATSTVMSIESLRDIASRVSDRINVPMEIKNK